MLLKHTPSAKPIIEDKFLRRYIRSIENYFGLRQNIQADFDEKKQTLSISYKFGKSEVFFGDNKANIVDSPEGFGDYVSEETLGLLDPKAERFIPQQLGTRTRAVIEISRRANDGGTEKAKQIINKLMEELQQKYGDVADAYYALHKELYR